MKINSDLLPNPNRVASIIKIVAKEEILSRFNVLLDTEISKKKFGEIVTEADVRAEERLVKELKKLVPKSCVVGEESYHDDQIVKEHFNQDNPVWIVDPLDGTKNFSLGNEKFCVIVAFCFKKTIYMGWIYNPLNDQMYYAAKGSGVLCNNERIHKNIVTDLSQMTGSVSQKRRNHLLSNNSKDYFPERLTRYRCLGLEYVDLAKGNLHFAEYQNLKPWDHAAGVLLMEEAGGFGAYAKSKEGYIPGPIMSKRFIAAHSFLVWDKVNNFLSV